MHWVKSWQKKKTQLDKLIVKKGTNMNLTQTNKN